MAGVELKGVDPWAGINAGGAATGAAGAAAAMSNPFTAGLQIMSMLGGLGGQSVNISKAGANTQSGLGFFGSETSGGIESGFSFGNPYHVAVAAVAVVLGVYAIKKFKRG